MSDLALQAATYVRRARAGDENAMAMLVRIGDEARKGSNQRAAQAFAAIKQYIDRNPPEPFRLGTEAVVIADTPQSQADLVAPVVRKKPDPELRKPPLPRGLFDKLFDPESFALVVVRACGYRHGLPAAAVVLASGPLLTKPVVQNIGLTNFGSDESSACFFHGVKFSGEKAWAEVAPHLDPPLRRCLAIGQCVGRARKIQAVRMPQSNVSAYSEIAGWELGE
jgi:hypothetical protein